MRVRKGKVALTSAIKYSEGGLETSTEPAGTEVYRDGRNRNLQKWQEHKSTEPAGTEVNEGDHTKAGRYLLHPKCNHSRCSV